MARAAQLTLLRKVKGEEVSLESGVGLAFRPTFSWSPAEAPLPSHSHGSLLCLNGAGAVREQGPERAPALAGKVLPIGGLKGAGDPVVCPSQGSTTLHLHAVRKLAPQNLPQAEREHVCELTGAREPQTGWA